MPSPRSDSELLASSLSEQSRRVKSKISQSWETTYKERPGSFIKEVLKAEVITPQQLDVLRAVQSAVRGTGPKIICLPAGHGIGKSWIGACLTIWAGATHPRALGLTTAPTWRQVERIL